MTLGICISGYSGTFPVTNRINDNGVWKDVTNMVDVVEFYQDFVSKRNGSSDWIAINTVKNTWLVPGQDVAIVDDLLSKSKVFSRPALVEPQYSGYVKCAANWSTYASEFAPELTDTIASIDTISDPKRQESTIRLVECYITFKTQHTINVQLVLSAATRGVKRQLFSEGKSFVKQGDFNPIQVRLDALCTALNAERCAGLDKALQDCGISLGVSWEDKLLSEDKVNELKLSVLSGDMDFGSVRLPLRTHLGVEKFNALVNQYNGIE